MRDPHRRFTALAERTGVRVTPASDTLLALAARVEAASGPDRELDAEAWLATTHGATRRQWSYIHKASGRECHIDETRDATRRLIIVPAYTSSLNSAMTLVPSGFSFEVRSSGTGDKGQANVWNPMRAPGQCEWRAKDCASPALALVAACLKARAAMEMSHG